MISRDHLPGVPFSGTRLRRPIPVDRSSRGLSSGDLFVRGVGLTHSSNPCCITWANGTSGCIAGLAPCPNTDKHYFWDGFHLTEAVDSVITDRCINGTGVCIPMNIQELVYF
ncbi:hypothetical protein RJ639_002869 [Escallonia herrerae]|uniref:GDSL esterase/lipase n=1 Tax=Escallonia herrerae TaxID=1293975 RepID=A0AA89AY96_9ASTE|nr:hypothetical protein RJ639_002869 [Escallonia herrerae]